MQHMTFLMQPFVALASEWNITGLHFTMDLMEAACRSPPLLSQLLTKGTQNHRKKSFQQSNFLVPNGPRRNPASETLKGDFTSISDIPAWAGVRPSEIPTRVRHWAADMTRIHRARAPMLLPLRRRTGESSVKLSLQTPQTRSQTHSIQILSFRDDVPASTHMRGFIGPLYAKLKKEVPPEVFALREQASKPRTQFRSFGDFLALQRALKYQ